MTNATIVDTVERNKLTVDAPRIDMVAQLLEHSARLVREHHEAGDTGGAVRQLVDSTAYIKEYMDLAGVDDIAAGERINTRIMDIVADILKRLGSNADPRR